MNKLSQFFTKTLKESPRDEESINAKLLIRAGFISKQMAGVYTILPLGMRVLKKINRIIREELNGIGAQEIYMPALQSKELWSKSGRWTTENKVMYQFKDNSGKDIGLGWTHEEVVTDIATKYISSYKDLPKAVYQIQTKFRDEPRAKSGILRGREFLMKDLYSFHADEKDRDNYYEKVKKVYQNIFKRIGLAAIETFASGGAFSKYSHEYQVVAEGGEDTIWHCIKCQIAVNQEIIDEYGKKCKNCQGELSQKKAIEVGNIFKLGTKFSKAVGLNIATKEGGTTLVEMASFGIGPTRVMGTIVEVSHDDKGIIWTRGTAPYDVHLIEIKNNKEKIKDTNQILNIIEQLEKAGLEVLHDDREDISTGGKFADADLIGCPWRVVISEKSLSSGGVEIKKRSQDGEKIVKPEELVNYIKSD